MLSSIEASSCSHSCNVLQRLGLKTSSPCDNPGVLVAKRSDVLEFLLSKERSKKLESRNYADIMVPLTFERPHTS